MKMTPAQIVNTFRNYLAEMNTMGHNLDDCILALDELEIVLRNHYSYSLKWPARELKSRLQHNDEEN